MRPWRACDIEGGLLIFLYFFVIILLITLNNIRRANMNDINQIEKRRDAILKQMQGIRSMERGSITEQYLKVPHKGKKEPVLRGPYYMLSRREGKKTVGYRLKTPIELERARRDVEAHKEFKKLCREFEELTERLGKLNRASGDDEIKKGLRSPSRRTPK